MCAVRCHCLRPLCVLFFTYNIIFSLGKHVSFFRIYKLFWKSGCLLIIFRLARRSSNEKPPCPVLKNTLPSPLVFNLAVGLFYDIYMKFWALYAPAVFTVHYPYCMWGLFLHKKYLQFVRKKH